MKLRVKFSWNTCLLGTLRTTYKPSWPMTCTASFPFLLYQIETGLAFRTFFLIGLVCEFYAASQCTSGQISPYFFLPGSVCLILLFVIYFVIAFSLLLYLLWFDQKRGKNGGPFWCRSCVSKASLECFRGRVLYHEKRAHLQTQDAQGHAFIDEERQNLWKKPHESSVPSFQRRRRWEFWAPRI